MPLHFDIPPLRGEEGSLSLQCVPVMEAALLRKVKQRRRVGP